MNIIMDQFIDRFARLEPDDQRATFYALIDRLNQSQQGEMYQCLRPMLQRDFIRLLPERGLEHLAEWILQQLDHQGLARAELVSSEWRGVIEQGQLWKKLLERMVRADPLWAGLAKRRNWMRHLFRPASGERHPGHQYYHSLYPTVVSDIVQLEANWRDAQGAARIRANGEAQPQQQPLYRLDRIRCQTGAHKGVYCIQFDDNKIVSGQRDNSIKIWSRATLECTKTLTGHTGSVLCLQYDDRWIVSGSSDATVRIWDVQSGELLNTLVHHGEAVLHLKFCNNLLVTCSKDRTVAVWSFNPPTDVVVKRLLEGHGAAVNVIDFDERYIVSASGDRTIKVWSIETLELIRTLAGHRRGIACLQYRDGLIISGSSDHTIRIWRVDTGDCVRILTGHKDLVRCLRFDRKRIVSGDYDGTIKVWDLKLALDPRAVNGSACQRTLTQHTGRVLKLQMDEFVIVSASHDDTILIWDFLCHPSPSPLVPLINHD